MAYDVELYRGARAFVASLEVDQETGEIGGAVPLEQIVQANPIGCAAFVLQVGKEVDMIQARIDELTKAIATKKATVERVKGTLFVLMDQGKVESLKSPDEAFRLNFWRDRDQSVGIEDESKIPAKYWKKIPATKQIDKRAIADALKAGEKVRGAQIVRKHRLEIKGK